MNTEQVARVWQYQGPRVARRLGVGVPREEDEPTDHIPIDLDPLDMWQIGDRVLRSVLDGGDAPVALDREQRAGTLPPLALGGQLRQDVAGTVAGIARGVGDGSRRSVEVRIDLPSGTRVTGVVSGVEKHRFTLTMYSTISAKREIVAWVRLLTLAVTEPDAAWVAELTGKKGTVHLNAPPADLAITLLDGLVDLRTRGMRFQLGLPPRTARAFAVQAARGAGPTVLRSALLAADAEWTGRHPERDDRWWVALLGPDAPLDRLDRLATLRLIRHPMAA